MQTPSEGNNEFWRIVAVDIHYRRRRNRNLVIEHPVRIDQIEIARPLKGWNRPIYIMTAGKSRSFLCEAFAGHGPSHPAEMIGYAVMIGIHWKGRRICIPVYRIDGPQFSLAVSHLKSTEFRSICIPGPAKVCRYSDYDFQC